jgi:hypothetical protein
VHYEFHRTHLLICWLVVLLISGEFAFAFMELVREGRAIAMYLAVDAVLRETRAGHHYQDLFVIGVRRLMVLIRRVKGAPSEGAPAPALATDE